MKKLALLALLLVSAATYAAAPIIWDDADFGKLLVNKGIRFKDGVQILEGVVTPTVTAVSAPIGSLFLRTSVTGGALFVKQDAGLTTNWAQTSGTNTGNVSVSVPANGLSINSATQVMTLITATASATGALASADWALFNAKQPPGSYITGLSSDVSAAGPGSVTATVNFVGGKSAAAIATAVGQVQTATALATPNTLVLRDPSADFATHNITLTALSTGLVHSNSSGVLSSSALTAADISANLITNTALAQMPANTFKANPTAALANVQDITTVTATAMLPAFIGDSGAGGVKGLVPAPAAGDAVASKFLNASGLWSTVTTTASTAVGGDIVFQQSGGTSVGTDIGNPYVFSTTVSVTAVKVGMYNGGTSGNTTFTVKQYRAGALFNSGIGVVASNAGLVYGGSITLSPGPLLFVANDVATVDINSVASGAPEDFSLIMSSGNTGATGPTGAFGAGQLVTKTTNYTSVNTDNYIICDATTGSFTVTLETATGNSGVSHVIKRKDSSASIVTVDPNGAQTIDGDLTYQLTDPKTSVTIVSDGSNWFVTAIQ